MGSISEKEPQILETGGLVDRRYQIEEMIGEGGMGQVYLAVDTLLSSDGEPSKVALKILRADLCKDEKYRKRFLREVVLTRAITNPHVVRTFEVGNHGDLLYFTMEYVKGEPLSNRLNGNPLDIAIAGIILSQITKGLVAIHSNGITHRDLKPGNVIVTKSGEVKITDFGIARAATSNLTTNQEILGSAFYMPPEMWIGDDITVQSDIYSLGVLAYELVTGVVPFDGAGAPEVMCKHLEQSPVPPLSLTPGVPAWLSDLIIAMLAKSPKKRPTCTQILRTLQANSGNGHINVSDSLQIDSDILKGVSDADDTSHDVEPLVDMDDDSISQPIERPKYIDQRGNLPMENTACGVSEETPLSKRIINAALFSVAFVMFAALMQKIGFVACATMWRTSSEDPSIKLFVKFFVFTLCSVSIISAPVLIVSMLLGVRRQAFHNYTSALVRASLLALVIFGSSFYTVANLARVPGKPLPERFVTLKSYELMTEELARVGLLSPTVSTLVLQKKTDTAKVPTTSMLLSDLFSHIAFTMLMFGLMCDLLFRSSGMKMRFSNIIKFSLACVLPNFVLTIAIYFIPNLLANLTTSTEVAFGPFAYNISVWLFAWWIGYWVYIALVATRARSNCNQ